MDKEKNLTTKKTILIGGNTALTPYESYDIIDAHCHIYPDKIAEKASQNTGRFYGLAMHYDGKVSTLREAGAQAGVRRYVIQSVATKPEQVSSINRFIAASVAEHPETMTGLGTLYPDSSDIQGDFEELLSLGLHGVKLHHDIQGFRMDDDRCHKIYELCAGRVPILFHCGDKRYDYSNPNRLKAVLDTYPELVAVGAHFGGYSVWEEAERCLSDYPNLYVDCSSSFFAMTDDEIRHKIAVFGPEKVLFGTDYPMWHIKTEVDRLFSLGLPEETLHHIFHDNAVRAYRINL